MINIFNRRELYITLELKQLVRIKQILEQNNIEYFTKTTNLQSSTFVGSDRARNGNLGINQNFSYEYRIFVHKTDFEKARFLIK